MPTEHYTDIGTPKKPVLTGVGTKRKDGPDPDINFQSEVESREWFHWACIHCNNQGSYAPPLHVEPANDSALVKDCPRCGAAVFNGNRKVGFTPTPGPV